MDTPKRPTLPARDPPAFHAHQCCGSLTQTAQISCTETPVAISVDAEQKKLDSINDRIRYIEKNASEIYDRCYQKVLLMPPAEAFRYWKTRTLP